MIGRTNAVLRRVVTLKECWRVSGLPSQPGGFPSITVGKDGSLYIAYMTTCSPSGACPYRAKKISPIGEELWDVALQSGKYADLNMTVFENSLYYISTSVWSSAKNDRLVKISAETGQVMASRDAKVGSHSVLRVLAEDDVLYVADTTIYRQRYVGGKFVDAEIASGGERHLNQAEVDAGILYYGTGDGGAHAVDIATRKELWYRNGLAQYPPGPVMGLGIDRTTKTLCVYLSNYVSRITFAGLCFVKSKRVSFDAYQSVFSGNDGYIYRRLSTVDGVRLVKENGYGAVFWVAKMPGNAGVPVVIGEDGSVYFKDGLDIIKARR